MATLEQIHMPRTQAVKPHVIFLHGLGGDARSTWMHNPADHATLWPQWLGEKCDCPVWLMGYDAALSAWSEEAMPLEMQATAVLDKWLNEPLLRDQPVVLVGHSLGGLVIKAALSTAAMPGMARLRPVLEQVKGVVFLATPHFGAELATLARLLKNILRTNEQVGDLRAHNPELQRHNATFRGLLEEHRWSVRIFSETRAVRYRTRWFSIPWGVRVVNSTSSDPSVPGEIPVQLQEDHLSICKPKDEQAQIFTSMVGFLSDLQVKLGVQSKPSATTAIPAPNDTHINANTPRDAADPVKTELAFATWGLHDRDATVVAAVCIVTDDVVSLAQEISDSKERVLRDPLLPASARQRLRQADVATLAADEASRGRMLNALATLSFSAYLYFSARDAWAALPADQAHQYMMVQPLLHRLLHQNSALTKASGSEPGFDAALATATRRARESSNTQPASVALAAPNDAHHRLLQELARWTARTGADYLAAPHDERTSVPFEHLRIHLRFAKNVATGEVHTRGKNPLGASTKSAPRL